jgi:hypothetical protein
MRTLHGLVLLLASVGLAACSSSGTGGGTPLTGTGGSAQNQTTGGGSGVIGAAGGSIGTGGSTISTGGSPSTGGSGGTPGSSGSSGTGGAAPLDGGSSGVTPVTLFPLAVGNQWTFQMTVTGPSPSCPAGPATDTITKMETVGGRTAFRLNDSCLSPSGDYDYSLNAGQIDVEAQGMWYPYLAAPVQDGHSWSDRSVTYTWRKVPSITVPAGTFSDCWSRYPSLSVLDVATYCNHVGPVQYVGASGRKELVSYSLK